MNIMGWFRVKAGDSDEDRQRRDDDLRRFKAKEDDQIDRLLQAADAVTRVFGNDDESPNVPSRNGRPGGG